MYVLYYVSRLRCWHLVWILVGTDHPCLGVGCHNITTELDAYREYSWLVRSLSPWFVF
jgi:hypothetical protein